MVKRYAFPLFLVLAVAAVGLTSQAVPAEALDRQTQRAIKMRIDLGLKYLRFKQEKNGSWNDYPGITALVVRAFMQSPRRYTEADGPFVRKALTYLAALAKPDGSIYHRDLPNYNTAVAVMALQASGNPAYQPLIKQAQTFLIDSQFDEPEGYAKTHKFYGAIGVGATPTNPQPDLDNLGFALAALKVSGLPADHPVWAKAVTFVERCQNRRASNDQPWAGNDGGFVFRPGFSYAGGTTSYASMTYVGLQNLLYAGGDKQDPRVQAAFDWIRHHYTVEENPGLGQQALYHYFYFMARALHAYGIRILVDATGELHDWRPELAGELMVLQNFDGSWVNELPLWWENNPILTTAFAILTLERIYDD